MTLSGNSLRQELASALEPYARQSSIGYLYLFYITVLADHMSHVLMLLVQRYAFLLGFSWRYANAKDITAKWHSAIAQHQLCSTRRT